MTKGTNYSEYDRDVRKLNQFMPGNAKPTYSQVVCKTHAGTSMINLVIKSRPVSADPRNDKASERYMRDSVNKQLLLAESQSNIHQSESEHFENEPKNICKSYMDLTDLEEVQYYLGSTKEVISRLNSCLTILPDDKDKQHLYCESEKCKERIKMAKNSLLDKYNILKTKMNEILERNSTEQYVCILQLNKYDANINSQSTESIRILYNSCIRYRDSNDGQKSKKNVNFSPHSDVFIGIIIIFYYHIIIPIT